MPIKQDLTTHALCLAGKRTKGQGFLLFKNKNKNELKDKVYSE